MELRPIKTELDYQNALKEIETLFNAKPNSPECDCSFLLIWFLLIAPFEKFQLILIYFH